MQPAPARPDRRRNRDRCDRLVRSEYNETIPAMLITGDTARDRLVLARASGLLLLHKPVSNAKLRAAVVNLVGTTGRAHPENDTANDGL